MNIHHAYLYSIRGERRGEKKKKKKKKRRGLDISDLFDVIA